MIAAASISADKLYRYWLTREWGDQISLVAATPSILFVMLNPSIADASVDDPTIRKCIGFAKRLGAASLTVVNLFAYRATNPDDMVAAFEHGVDIVGPEHDAETRMAIAAAGRVVFAWGGVPTKIRPTASLRIQHLRASAKAPLCFGTTMDGNPRHPLYLSYDSKLMPWSERIQGART